MTTMTVLLALLAIPAFAQLRNGEPETVGINRAQLERAAGLLDSEVRDGKVGAASLLVARRGVVVLNKGFGHLSTTPGSPAADKDSIFIVASITKPVTAVSLMMLVEQGRLSLTDRVSRYIPEFKGADHEKVRVKDLLSHTSGMPDMLPENTELRREHAPIQEFVKRAATTPLLFAPGTAFRYQSMGVLLAAEIVERLSKTPLRDFEREHIYTPLGMTRSSLGIGKMRIEDTVQVMSTGEDPKEFASWGPNSSYWRNFGAPWGGMHTTTHDLAALLQTFLDGGKFGGKELVSPATAKAMTSDQNEGLNAPWGLGWALGRSTAWNRFGDLVSARTFGHAGASGTVEWADPETGLICVVLTNRPLGVDDGRLLRLVSNAVAASAEK